MLASILEVASNLYQEDAGRKKPLSIHLRAHGIWSDGDRWRDVIESVLKTKIQQSKTRQARRKSNIELQDGFMKKKANAVKKGFGFLKGMMESKEKKFNKETLQY